MNQRELGKRLKIYRERKKVTIKELSDTTQIPATTYREWEYGRSIKGSEAYLKLAKYFDVSLYELLTGEKTDSNLDLLNCVKNIENELKKLKEVIHSLA